MKDPHEHSDTPHESEDVRKRDCRKYKELYGKHFTKDLCEWAVERMENRNGTTHHYSLDEVKSIWHKYKMNDLHNANWYDVMYVMNMAYADFYGRCLPNIMNVLCMLIFTLVIPTVTKVLLSKDG